MPIHSIIPTSRHYSQKFERGLPLLRVAYASAKLGDEINTRKALNQAKEIIGGIEGNFIRRILHWMDGDCDKPECYWCQKLIEVKASEPANSKPREPNENLHGFHTPRGDWPDRSR